MGCFVPNSAAEQAKMLEFLGLNSLSDLYSELPEELKLSRELSLPEPKSELQLRRFMSELADKNVVFPAIFRGAGAYRHYIPSVVKAVGGKETLKTAYTPYQPEISQGVLQSIFEYQTMICELTGMDASNASVYDGATACAEAIAMCAEKKRRVAYLSQTINPQYLETIKTYCFASGRELVIIPEKDGVTDIDFLRQRINNESSCLIIQQPNFNGLIEDAGALTETAKAAGAKAIICINPIFAAIGKTAREYGADIAVGEGQPLGLGLSFGGPYLGVMSCVKEMSRKLPGRIIGQTVDLEGRRAFVMTMQAREQHIRREKASSSICSNQAHCAMTAAAYMAAMGPAGIYEVAMQSMSKAYYLAERISGIPGFELSYSGEFFHEFVTNCPVEPSKLMRRIEQNGILGGLPLEGGREHRILWCCTELNTKAQMDKLVDILREGV